MPIPPRRPPLALPSPRRARAGRRALALAAAAALALPGCRDEKTRLPFTTVFSPTTPVLTGPTPVFYLVRDQPSQPLLVFAELTTDDGATWRAATPAPGTPAVGLLQGAPAGASGAFVWDPLADLGPGLHRGVRLRVFGFGRDLGVPGETTALVADLTDRLDPIPAATGPAVTGPVGAPLPDGTVWLAGGEVPGAGLAGGAVRYDPVLDRVEPAPGLSAARAAPGWALLPGGAVLVAGGRDAGGAPSAAVDAFGPDGQGALAVRSGPPLAIARVGPAVAPLGDGRALVLGGEGTGGLVDLVEVVTPPGTVGAGSTAALTSDARTARRGATATPLPDGRVLLAGGVDAQGALVAGCVLVGAAGVSASTLTTARAEHAAVALPDGRVFVVGGTSTAGQAAAALPTADLLDPATGQTTSVAAMRRARRRCGAAYVAGAVVVFGGDGPGDAAATAERFDLETGAWSDVRVPGRSRADAVAVATATGRVVVAGGGQAPEVYRARGRPGAEAFDAHPTIVPAARADHTATPLFDGSVLLVGGTAGVTSALALVERLDPVARRLERRASLARARAGHAAAQTPFGGVLVAGGRGPGGLVAEAELYDPLRDAWTDAGALATPREGATATLLGDGRVLVAGGRDASGAALGSTELWSAFTGRFEPGPALPSPRAGHQAARLGLGALVGPGRGADGAAQADAFLVAMDLGGNAGATGVHARAGAAVASPPLSAQGLLFGGADAAGPRADVAFFDARSFPFAPPVFLGATRPLLDARQDGLAVGLLDGRRTLLLGGRGARGGVADTAELWVFTFAVDDGASRRPFAGPRTVVARRGATGTLLPDGRVAIVGGRDERGVAVAGLELFVP